MKNLQLGFTGTVMPINQASDPLPLQEQPGKMIPMFFKQVKLLLVLLFLLVLWFFAPVWLRTIDATAGSVDQGIWLLIILSLIAFMLVTGLCWWLLHRFWLTLGLPPLTQLVSQFNSLALWQQLGFFWLSFLSLLLAAFASLIAIC